MNGRVLTEEELAVYEKRFTDIDTFNLEIDLIATIRDRDKTIAELQYGALQASKLILERDKMIAELQWVQAKFEQYYQIASEQSGRASKAEQRNTILREALEQVQWYKDGTGWMRCPVCGWTQDAGHGTDCAIGEALAKSR